MAQGPEGFNASEHYRALWKQPWDLVKKRKEELQVKGESLVERLAVTPLPIRLKYPQELTENQISSLGFDITQGAPYIEIRRGSIFDMYVYGDKTTGEEHVAVLKGLKEGENENVPIRIHSSCLTAETFAASNCDCQEQVDMALTIAENEGYGGVVWLHQEGRGNGLAAKAEQLKLMIYSGMNTVEAFEALGLPSEQRDFTAAADILKDLGITSIRLITNNPDKVAQTQAMGINVVDRIPCIIAPINEVVRNDLRAKRDRLGHHFGEEM